MNQPKIKTFFERPEGTVGLGFIAAMVVAAGFAAYAFLPFIITLLANTITAIALGCVLTAMVAVLMNDNFRFVVRSVFQSSMRALTGLWIPVDPIGILKNYLLDMKDRLGEVEISIEQLNGQIATLKANIKNRKDSIKNLLRLAKAAKKREDPQEAELQASMAARERDYASSLEELLMKVSGFERVLSKVKKNLDFLYVDTQHRVQIEEEKYKTTRSAYKAMRGAKRILQGDKAKEIYDQTLEYLAADIGMKLGEMDRFMTVSKDFMNGMDLQNAVFNDKGLELLEEWEKKGSSILDYEHNREKIRVDVTGLPNDDPDDGTATDPPQARAQTTSPFSDIFYKS